MNREIKFRAWPVNGFKGISKMQDNKDCMRLLYNKACETIDVSSYYIFMQFTGLYDSEGKEIYEGDILKEESFLTKIRDNSKVPNSDHVNYYVVEFNTHKKVNGWQLRTIKTTRYDNFGLGDISNSHLWTITDNSKIIGNIYENPEYQSKKENK